MSSRHHILQDLFSRTPELEGAEGDILRAYSIILRTFEKGGTLLVCGNGGSAADSEHIVGELMKGFLKKRPIPEEELQKLKTASGEAGIELGTRLQGCLRAISLTSHPSLRSAITNDTGDDMEYAQQVYGYGRRGDVLLGISTSGNAANVAKAVVTAGAFGLATIGLTGEAGGRLKDLCDCVIRAPSAHVAIIQEYHQRIYHALCGMLEDHFFKT